jgi:hypothetical protein
MKDDVGPAPDDVPKKRRQLEAAPDLWLAMWLGRDDLTPSERRRVQEEKDRRKERTVPVIVGFTGTREGLTPQQRSRLREELSQDGIVEAHHGDCVGGDEQFHSLCRGAKIPIVIHPPDNGKARAFCDGADRIEKAKPFLDRNKDIVRASSLMYGCPKERSEPPPARGQGTWSTIRYARSRGVMLKVIMPDGSLLGEKEDE